MDNSVLPETETLLFSIFVLVKLCKVVPHHIQPDVPACLQTISHQLLMFLFNYASVWLEDMDSTALAPYILFLPIEHKIAQPCNFFIYSITFFQFYNPEYRTGKSRIAHFKT